MRCIKTSLKLIDLLNIVKFLGAHYTSILSYKQYQTHEGVIAVVVFKYNQKKTC